MARLFNHDVKRRKALQQQQQQQLEGEAAAGAGAGAGGRMKALA